MYLIETPEYYPVKTESIEGVVHTLHVWGYYTPANETELEAALNEEGYWEDEEQLVTVSKVAPETVEDIDFSFA